MISEDKIKGCEAYQQEQVQTVARRIKEKGHISSAEDFYPDVQLKKSIGYTRGKVPIKPLMLLYEQVVVKVPPLKTRKQLENFLGISYDEFIYAVQKKSIIAIIDDVENYRYNFFEELIDLNPPALFARGVALLNHANLETVLDDGKKAIRDNKISLDSRVQKSYEAKGTLKQGKNLNETIENDLAILYADLFLFGHDQSIDEILHNSSPYEIYKNLKAVNEILTYPILFGMGGTANFESTKALQAQIPFSIEVGKSPDVNYAIISSNLRNLLAFFDLATKDLSMREIIAFQEKGGSRKLQKAMEQLTQSVNKKLVAGDDTKNSIILLEELEHELINIYRSLDPTWLTKVDKQKKYMKRGSSVISLAAGTGMAVGGLTLGLGALLASIGGFAVPIASFLIPKAVNWITGDKVTDIVNRCIISKKFSPTVASIWDAKKIMDEVRYGKK